MRSGVFASEQELTAAHIQDRPLPTGLVASAVTVQVGSPPPARQAEAAPLRPIAGANPERHRRVVGLLVTEPICARPATPPIVRATLLAHVLERAPQDDETRFRLAAALFHQQKVAEALPHLERLIAAEPDNAAYQNLLAGCLALAKASSIRAMEGSTSGCCRRIRTSRRSCSTGATRYAPSAAARRRWRRSGAASASIRR